MKSTGARKTVSTKRRKAVPPSQPRAFITPGGQVIRSLGVAARAIGTSVGMLSMVLDGKRRPSLFLALKWSSFLGISVERFVIMLYGEEGIVPVDSPVGLRLRRERMPRFLGPVTHKAVPPSKPPKATV